MEQKYFLEIMGKFPKEFKDLILTDPLLNNCIQSGINEKLGYTKILEKTLLCFVKHSNKIMKDFMDCKMNCENQDMFFDYVIKRKKDNLKNLEIAIKNREI